MTGYSFEAMEKGGSIKNGVLQADTAQHARSLLREEGLVALSVIEVSRTGKEKPDSRRLRRLKVSTSALSMMTRQFASLMAAKVSLDHVLSGLIKQAGVSDLGKALAGVRGRVLEGTSLAASMEDYPHIFSEFYRSIIAAGEKSGELDTTLLKLADYIESSHELKRKVGLAFIYPIIMVAVSALVVTGLMVFVVPKVVDVFTRTNQTLPWLTTVFIFLSDVLRAYGIWIIAGVTGSIFFLKRIFNDRSRRYRLHLWLLRAPVLGKVIQSAETTKLSNALAIMLGSGVPLTSALEAACGVLSNLPMREALENARTAVLEGGDFSHAMEKSGLFPPLLIYFIANGEQTDQLGVMLEKAAAQQTMELTHRMATLTSLLGPLMTLAMGIMVLIIVIAVLLPIFEMSQIVR